MDNHDNQYDSDGAVLNGFDYRLQVRVVGGVVQACAHPESARSNGLCCNATRYATRCVKFIDGHEVRHGN